MTYQDKPLLTALASHMDAGLSSKCSLFMVWENSGGCLIFLDPYTHVGDPEKASGCQFHVGSTPDFVAL